MHIDIKYCKNCVNYSPFFSHHKLKPDENYSWGYCRIINQIEIKNNRLIIAHKDNIEVVVEKLVPANQVVMVDWKKICPAYSNLSDIFIPENALKNVYDIDVLKDLKYVKCKNCNHIFASPESELNETNNYTCPLCFHSAEFLKKEHFSIKPEFLNKVVD